MALEGFPGRFGSGSDEVTEGVRTDDGRGLSHWQLIFVLLLWDIEWYLLLKDPLLCWDGPLEIRV